ncbi:MAG TPA: hypothetical protein VIO57_04405 [Chloroflexota bacterium]|jgi:hypothetical protein
MVTGDSKWFNEMDGEQATSSDSLNARLASGRERLTAKVDRAVHGWLSS